MARLRAHFGIGISNWTLALAVLLVPASGVRAQFPGFGGGYGYGFPGYGYGYGYGFPGYGYGYGYPGFGYGFGYPGFGFGFGGYGFGSGYGTLLPIGYGFGDIGLWPYGFTGISALNAFGNPYFGMGLSPLGVQSALGERYLLGNTGRRVVVPGTAYPGARPAYAPAYPYGTSRYP